MLRKPSEAPHQGQPRDRLCADGGRGASQSRPFFDFEGFDGAQNLPLTSCGHPRAPSQYSWIRYSSELNTLLHLRTPESGQGEADVRLCSSTRVLRTRSRRLLPNSCVRVLPGAVLSELTTVTHALGNRSEDGQPRTSACIEGSRLPGLVCRRALGCGV